MLLPRQPELNERQEPVASATPAGHWRRRRVMPNGVDPLGIVGVLAFVTAWQLLTRFLPSSSLPAPLSVLTRLANNFLAAPELAFYGLPNVSLLGSIVYTGENVLLAVVSGTVIGALAGLITARFRLARAIADPVMLTAGAVPILVAAPFFLIWFGVGQLSSVLLVVFYVAVILYVFAQRAADSLDPVYEDSARTLGAGPRRIVRDILIPGTVPEILGGVRIALAGAWGLEAIAELLGSQRGVGKIVEVLAGSTDVQGILAALVLLGLVAVAFDALAAVCFARIAVWSVAARPGGGEAS